MIASLPWPRAIQTALLMTGLGVAMHVVAEGSAGFTFALVPVLLVAVVATRLVQGRPGSAGRVITLLLLGQAGVHVAISPMSTTASAHMQHMMAADPATMTHATMLRRSGDAYGPKIAAAVTDSLSCLFANPVMLVAHVVTAAAIGWWLAAGERLSSQVIAVLAGSCSQALLSLFLALRSPIRRTSAAIRTVEIAPSTPLRRLFLTAGTTRRGPPAVR